ncbi:MAG: hypothetical protein QW346_02530, partial [Candidatus Micrarchaeaceae archaeon]
MDVNIIEDKSDSFIAEVTGMDRAILELIKDRLLNVKDVDFVTVAKEHPESPAARLIVKASKNPKNLVAKA